MPSKGTFLFLLDIAPMGDGERFTVLAPMTVGTSVAATVGALNLAPIGSSVGAMVVEPPFVEVGALVGGRAPFICSVVASSSSNRGGLQDFMFIFDISTRVATSWFPSEIISWAGIYTHTRKHVFKIECHHKPHRTPSTFAFFD